MEAVKSVPRPDSDYVMVSRSALEDLLGSLGGIQNGVENCVYNPDEFLAEFKQACRIDFRLSPLTIREHLRHAQRLCDFLDKHPLHATRQELRQFLMLNPANNAIKAVRVLYGKFLNSDLGKSFKVPQSAPRVMVVPTREQLTQTHENLKTLELRAAFLLLTTSGLRRHELLELKLAQIDLGSKMIIPNGDSSQTKFQWVTCFNEEAKAAIQELLRMDVRMNGTYDTHNIGNMNNMDNTHVFTIHRDTLTKKFKRASSPSGFKITPQVLRDWFCNEMGRLGVQDRYIDAFCGRIPKSVLARHYTDYSPDRLNEIYDKADLRVFKGIM